MPIFKHYTRSIDLVFSVLLLGGFILSGSLAQAQSTADASPSPFEFHDLDIGRDTGAYFGADRPDMSDADPLKRLEYAAQEGSAVAMWKLGRIYSRSPEGDGNHLRAFEMFSRVVRSQAEQTPYSDKAPYTANALVALGSYYRDGIPDSYVRKNRQQAWSMYLTAATYYGDPKAQFALFEMCDAEDASECSDVQAGRWLKRSAVNGHVNGQARFGHRQFEGVKGVRRDKVEGLKWLTIARERAHGIRQSWVYEFHENAFSIATLEERTQALSRAEIWMRNHCNDVRTC